MSEINNTNENSPVSVKPKKKFYKKWWFWAVVVLLVIFVGASAGGSKGGSSAPTSSPQATATTPTNKWDDKFEIKDLKLSGSGTNSKITGSLVNKTDKEYSYLQVEINLYDKDGAQIGSTIANINNLEANATWKFETYTLKDGVSTIKVKDITGF